MGADILDQMTAAVGFLRLCRVGLDGIVMVGADISLSRLRPSWRAMIRRLRITGCLRTQSDRRLTEVE